MVNIDYKNLYCLSIDWLYGESLNALSLMPNYDYVCETCEHEFEVFQSMNDPKLTDCPKEKCLGSVRRLLGTGGGVIFKGSGFYQTDYRSDSYKKGAASEKSSSSEAKKSSEKKD